MRFLFSITVFFILTVGAPAQSGRNKQPVDDSSPAARPPARRTPLDLPPLSQILVKAAPLPTATPPVKPTEPEENEVITVDSSLVPIPASVTDTVGNAVTNLKLEDFTLMIDGKTEEISEISRSSTPVRLALLFDNSSSVSIAREFERKAATRFFKRVLRPDCDRAALYSIANVFRLEQPLTNDIRLLIQAIEAFPPPGGATKLLDGVIAAANYLRDFKDGRRVIVIVSDGADTISDITLEREGFASVIRQAQLADCQIYVVKTTDFENLQRTGRRGSNANIQDLTADQRMHELAVQTGGEVYSPLDEKELDLAFTQIAAELAEQYVLSYYPTNAKRDGSFKQISLQVKSNKNLTVRTRKGYYVPKS